MKTERNTEGLRQSAQKKRQEAFDKVEKGIQKLVKENRPINFNTVAEASGVSKAWLYREADVKARVEQLREQSSSKKTLPIKQRASDASKDTLIRTLKERIKRLDSENRDLRRQNEVAYSHVFKARELEREVERLKAENERLRQKAVPEGHREISEDLKQQLADLGVTLNSTLSKLILETPQGIVDTAIEALKEASQTSQVHNPGGFLNKAITDAWEPNETYQQNLDMEEFNLWWKWAYREKIVLAATQKDGVRYVLTSNEDWIPFSEATARYIRSKD